MIQGNSLQAVEVAVSSDQAASLANGDRQPGFMLYQLVDDSLEGVQTRDPLKCFVKGTSISTLEVAHSVRILGDFKMACSELGITESQALQALSFYAVFKKAVTPEQHAERELSMEQLMRGDP